MTAGRIVWRTSEIAAGLVSGAALFFYISFMNWTVADTFTEWFSFSVRLLPVVMALGFLTSLGLLGLRTFSKHPLVVTVVGFLPAIGNIVFVAVEFNTGNMGGF